MHFFASPLAYAKSQPISISLGGDMQTYNDLFLSPHVFGVWAKMKQFWLVVNQWG